MPASNIQLEGVEVLSYATPSAPPPHRDSPPPVLLVSGFLCPSSEFCNRWYWDCAHHPGITWLVRLPWAMSHQDRACELYAQIRGCQTIYYHRGGKTGTDFTGRGLYPEWSSEHPVALIGHSIGGGTCYALQLLLVYLSQRDLLTGESLDSAPFNMVSSITTIASPLRGCLLAYVLGLPQTRCYDGSGVRRHSIGYFLTLFLHAFHLYGERIAQLIFGCETVFGLHNLFEGQGIHLDQYWRGEIPWLVLGLTAAHDMSIARSLELAEEVRFHLLDESANTTEYNALILYDPCLHKTRSLFAKLQQHVSLAFTYRFPTDNAFPRRDAFLRFLAHLLYIIVLIIKDALMYSFAIMLRRKQYFRQLIETYPWLRNQSDSTSWSDGEMHFDLQYYDHERVTIMAMKGQDHSSVVPLPANRRFQREWFRSYYRHLGHD